MKAHDRLSCLAVVLLAGLYFGGIGEPAAAPAAQPNPKPKPIDWQKRADEATWDFDYRPNDLKQCVERVAGKYAAKAEPLQDREGRPLGLLVRIMKGDALAFEFEGHAGTVFVIDGDRLYRSAHHSGTSGSAFVATDLTTGIELWRTRLRGIGPVEHSAYCNRLAVHLADGGLWVFGHESQGGYIEILDPKTGKTIGHRALTAKNPEPLRETEHTLYRHAWADPTMAKLTDVAWLAGRYEGKAYGGNPCQLTLTDPLADAMTGTFAYAQDGKVVFTEHFTIAEKDGTLILRVRQFNEDLRSSEPNPEHAPKRLVKVEKDAVYFNGRTFRKGKGGGLELFVAARNPDGSVREDHYTFAPIAGR